MKNNWEYIAAGAMIVGGVALMCTGIGGPVGLALAGGALSMGMSVAQQKATNGKVDWGQAGVDGLTGMIPIPGAGAAGALVKTGVKTVGKTVIKDSVKTAVKGAGSKVVSGTKSLAEKAVPKLTKTAESGCFVAGTQVLMGDGSSKNIEDVRVGDEVTAADPETGETHGRRVIETYVHENIGTFEVETSAGTVTSTAEHPFYVQGKGWVPVRELRSGDRLVDPKGSEVDVVSVAPTGETATVYNFNVDDLHTYHVATGRDTWVRVHNTCTPPSRFVTTQSGVTIDRNSINASVSVQKQGRHVLGAREYNGTKSYFNSHADAQQVLDDFHSGAADVMGVKGNDVVVRTNGVTGYNMNPGANILHQPTNVFFIKGTVKPSVVPYNPTWTP